MTKLRLLLNAPEIETADVVLSEAVEGHARTVFRGRFKPNALAAGGQTALGSRCYEQREAGAESEQGDVPVDFRRPN